MVRALAICLLTICLCDQAGAVIYFCPRGGMGLEGMGTGPRPSLIASHGGLALQWPRSPKDLRVTGGDLVVLALLLDDCSDGDFLCWKVRHTYHSELDATYLLVVPRIIVPNREYQFKGVHLSTKVAARNSIVGAKQSIQVISQQQVEGKEVQFGFTLEEQRGAIYWDGFFFGRSEIGQGQLCVLRYDVGLFPGVKIEIPMQ